MKRQDAALALVSTLTFIAVGEIGLRLIGFSGKGLDTDDRDRSASVQAMGADLQPYQMIDPDLLWRERPGRERFQDARWGRGWHVTINSRGFRGPELGRPPGRPLVLCAGDSVTFGFRVDDPYTYPAALQELLRGAGFPHAEVVNVGSNGYSSEQGRVWLARLVAELHPDVVIVDYGINDDRVAPFQDAHLMGHTALVGRSQRLLAGSAIYAALKRVIVREKILHLQTLGPRVPLDRYRENLAAIVADARAHGARPILMAPTSQYDFQSTAKHEWHAPISVYRHAMAAVAHEEGVAFLDHPLLSGRLPESQAHFIDACHPDAYGICLMADELAPLVRDALVRRP